MYIAIFSDIAKIRQVTTYYVGDVTTSDKPGNCNTTEGMNNCTLITSM